VEDDLSNTQGYRKTMMEVCVAAAVDDDDYDDNDDISVVYSRLR
jgi:hypothetical protein